MNYQRRAVRPEPNLSVVPRPRVLRPVPDSSRRVRDARLAVVRLVHGPSLREFLAACREWFAAERADDGSGDAA